MNCLFERKSLNKIIVMILISLSFLLTGCGRAPEVNTALLQNEAGDFQYADVLWGMDRAGVEVALNTTLDPVPLNTSSGNAQQQLYRAADSYTLLGLPASIFCEFDASGLYSIQFSISPTEEETQTYWESLTDTLLAQYGSVDPVNQDSSLSDPFSLSSQSEVYLWENSDQIHTVLSARKTSMNGKHPMVHLFLYRIP